MTGILEAVYSAWVDARLTFCTRVLEELNWANTASTATLTELTRAARRINQSARYASQEGERHAV